MSSLGSALYFAAFIAVAIGVFGSISYAMTNKNPRVRVWGCRIAAALFVIFGLGFIAVTASDAEGGSAGYLWAVAMFAVAAWQWRLSNEPR